MWNVKVLRKHDWYGNSLPIYSIRDLFARDASLIVKFSVLSVMRGSLSKWGSSCLTKFWIKFIYSVSILLSETFIITNSQLAKQIASLQNSDCQWVCWKFSVSLCCRRSGLFHILLVSLEYVKLITTYKKIINKVAFFLLFRGSNTSNVNANNTWLFFFSNIRIMFSRFTNLCQEL